MKQGSNANRLDWLDVFKCIAMLAVITGHAAVGETPDTLKYYIYSFHMPMFFIISGMTLYLQTRKREYGLGEMFINKCRTLLWPYFIFNVLFLPLWYCYFKLFNPGEGSIKQLLVAIIYSNPSKMSLPISASWFLTTLFLALMIFFVLMKIARGRDSIIVIISLILGIGGYILSLSDKTNLLYPWHVSTVPVAIMLLMAGYYFMKHLDWLENNLFKINTGGKKTVLVKEIAWIIVALAAGIVIARYNVKISMGLNHYGSFLMFAGAVIAFSIAFFMLSRIIPAVWVIRLIGRNTIVYLCMHELCIIAMNTLSETTRAFVTTYPLIAAVLIMAALIPVAYVIERWLPFLIGRKK